MDVDHTKQEINLLKMLPFVSSNCIAFCYF